MCLPIPRKTFGMGWSTMPNKTRSENIKIILAHLKTVGLPFSPVTKLNRESDDGLRAWALRIKREAIPDDLAQRIEASRAHLPTTATCTPR